MKSLAPGPRGEVSEAERPVKILYEDGAIVVCVKPAGLSSQQTETGRDLPAALSAQTGCGVFPVHRLDTAAAGVMVCAKTRAAAVALSRQIAAGGFEKEYLCLVHGVPEAPAAELTDLLFRDAKKNKSYVVARPRKGVKEAKLAYRLLGTEETPAGPVSLLRVRLFTGRTHQIRVQLASRKLPLLGDGKYGAADREKTLALFSAKLSFTHPETGERLTFEQTPSFAEAFPTPAGT